MWVLSLQRGTYVSLFFLYTVAQSFWSYTRQLFGNHIITESDVILRITHQSEDALLYNHLILLSKQYIYNCKLKGVFPPRPVFLTKAKAVFETEHRIFSLKEMEQAPVSRAQTCFINQPTFSQ